MSGFHSSPDVPWEGERTVSMSRTELLAENQRLREALSDLYGYANARLPLTEGADAHLQKAREALAGDAE